MWLFWYGKLSVISGPFPAAVLFTVCVNYKPLQYVLQADYMLIFVLYAVNKCKTVMEAVTIYVRVYVTKLYLFKAKS